MDASVARMPREHRLETREARARLKARTEPYWRQIVPGTFLGYRKGRRATAWIVRQRQGAGYGERRIGTPDDAGEPAHLVDRFGELGQSGQRLAVEPARQFIRP